MRVLASIGLGIAGLLAVAASADAARIKDIASVEGVRSNQLTGYGVVVGLWRASGRVLRCQPFHPGGVDLP